MKFFSPVLIWILILSITLLSGSSTLTVADPVDDLSFTLGPSTQKEVYNLLPAEQVSKILKDRLDLFPVSQVPRLSQHLVELCRHYRFDPAFILSLIQVESRFKIRAVSPVGAAGLMQLMLPTANFVVRDLGVRLSGHEGFQRSTLMKKTLNQSILLDPFVNTAIGIAYLAWLRDYYRGRPYYVLAAYNVGPARMNELLARKSFEPVETKKYFQAIRRGIPAFRFYKASSIGTRSSIRLSSGSRL